MRGQRRDRGGGRETGTKCRPVSALSKTNSESLYVGRSPNLKEEGWEGALRRHLLLLFV